MTEPLDVAAAAVLWATAGLVVVVVAAGIADVVLPAVERRWHSRLDRLDFNRVAADLQRAREALAVNAATASPMPDAPGTASPAPALFPSLGAGAPFFPTVVATGPDAVRPTAPLSGPVTSPVGRIPGKGHPTGEHP